MEENIGRGQRWYLEREPTSTDDLRESLIEWLGREPTVEEVWETWDLGGYAREP